MSLMDPLVATDTGAKSSGAIWTPPKDAYTWRDRAGSQHKLEDITRVDFTAHHVVFWRGEFLVRAEIAESVNHLEQLETDEA